MNLRYEIADYTQDLSQYIAQERLPKNWFENLDHIAIKAANTTHFETLTEQIKQGTLLDPLGVEVKRIIRTEMDGRRIDIAQLVGPLAVGSWAIDQLEIMEPRLEAVGKFKAGVDHMEFYEPDFSAIEEHFMKRGFIDYELQPKGRHNTLCIIFGKKHRELKFTDTKLRSVLDEELTSGEAEVIYQSTGKNWGEL